jgi:hypothetical protein
MNDAATKEHARKILDAIAFMPFEQCQTLNPTFGRLNRKNIILI